MAGAGKTLKVSYGSFSCTLEGFDDPVATLRSITEHFQSLSSPERLFAAEGPVPGIDLMLPLPGEGNAEAGQVLPDPVPRTGADNAARSADGADRDADVSRLMDQTIGQMQGEEQRRRQATIGHLKAAVAATADDPAAGLGGEPARAARYRADLASVVRPTRATLPRLPPGPEHQSPLLLVPELRVQLPPDAPQGPAESEPEDSSRPPGAPPDFAEFAVRIEAAGLTDLMEAAAAFVICAEGASDFSRPDLMRHLSALPGARGGTPEDQMRGFGLLLRHGRILRAGRGTFTLRDDAPVLVRARRLLG